MLAQYDTPDAILAHPADEFVARFVGDDRGLKRLSLRRVAEVELDPRERRRRRRARPADTTLRDALSLMLTEGRRALVVVDDGGAPRGVLRSTALERAPARELLRRAGAGHPRLRRGQRLRHREPPLLLGLGAGPLGATRSSRRCRARQADADRGRGRLRDLASPPRCSRTATGRSSTRSGSSRRSSTRSRASRSSSSSSRTGLTVTTVEIALVGYTLLILYRNILAGSARRRRRCSRPRAGWG